MNPYSPPNDTDDLPASDHSLSLELAEMLADFQTRVEALAAMLAELAKEEAGLEGDLPEIVEEEPTEPPE